jgi:hypothetical protein
MEQNQETSCPLCHGTKSLDQRGIARVYLLAWKSSLVMILAGVAGGIFYSKFAFILAVIGYVMPLASADLRLLLYPFVSIAALTGKKASCPKCTHDGSIFRSF